MHKRCGWQDGLALRRLRRLQSGRRDCTSISTTGVLRSRLNLEVLFLHMNLVVLQMVFDQLLLLSQFNLNAFLSAGCGAAFQPTFDFIIPSLPRRLTSPPRTSTQPQGGLSLSHIAEAHYAQPKTRICKFQVLKGVGNSCSACELIVHLISLSLSRFRGLFTKV